MWGKHIPIKFNELEDDYTKTSGKYTKASTRFERVDNVEDLASFEVSELISQRVKSAEEKTRLERFVTECKRATQTVPTSF